MDEKQIKDLPGLLDKEKLVLLAQAQITICQLDFENMFDFLVGLVTQALGVKRCAIFRVASDQEKAKLVAGQPKEAHGIDMHFSSSELKCLEQVIETKSFCIIEDPACDKRTQVTRELIHHEKINAILWVPLAEADEMLGVIVIDATDDKKSFTEQDIIFCQLLSYLVSAFLKRDLILGEKTEKEASNILWRASEEFAHQLKNPLVTIGGFARRIVKKCKSIKDPILHDYLRRIIGEVGKVELVFSDFLKMCPAKGRDIQISVNHLLKEAIETVMMNEFVGHKKINIDSKLDKEIPSIYMDPVRVNDVFFNVLHNAVEAIESEGTIYIRSRKQNGYARVSISNTGGSIEKGHVDKIFDPFYSTKSHGTGLGLAIAESIVHFYGGRIKLTHKYEDQATFVIKIPFDQS